MERCSVCGVSYDGAKLRWHCSGIDESPTKNHGMEIAKWYVFISKRTHKTILFCHVYDHPFKDKVKIQKTSEQDLPYFVSKAQFDKQMIKAYELIGEL